MSTEAFDVFISYARKDIAIVSQWVDELRRGGVKVFIDMAELTPGSVWGQHIVAAIEKAPLVMCFISSQSLASDYVSKEVALAQSLRKKIIPVYIEEVRLQGQIGLIIADLQKVQAYQPDQATLWAVLQECLRSVNVRWHKPSGNLRSIYPEPPTATPPEVKPPQPQPPAENQKAKVCEVPAPKEKAPPTPQEPTPPPARADAETLPEAPPRPQPKDPPPSPPRRPRRPRARVLMASLTLPILGLAYSWQGSLFPGLTKSADVVSSPPPAPVPPVIQEPPTTPKLVETVETLAEEAQRLAREYYVATNGPYADQLAFFADDVKYFDKGDHLTRADILALLNAEGQKWSAQHYEIVGKTTVQQLHPRDEWECRTPLKFTWEKGVIRNTVTVTSMVTFRPVDGALKIVAAADVKLSRGQFQRGFVPTVQEKLAIELAVRATRAFDSRTPVDHAIVASYYAPLLHFFGREYRREDFSLELDSIAEDSPIREHDFTSPAPALVKPLDGQAKIATVSLHYTLRAGTSTDLTTEPRHILVDVQFNPDTGVPLILSQRRVDTMPATNASAATSGSVSPSSPY